MMVTLKKLKSNNKDDKIVVSSEQYEGKENKIFICSWCNCTLSRLIDHSGQNPSLYCSRCQMSFDPEYDNLRHESKIVTPREDVEPAIRSIGYDIEGEVQIQKTVPIRGGFAELQKKGLRIKNYHPTEKS